MTVTIESMEEMSTGLIEGSSSGDNISLAEDNRTIYINFAVIMDPYPIPERNPDGVAQALNIISYIGVIVSIVCLLLTIIFYLSSRSRRSSLPGKLHINLSLGLIGTYIMFIVCQNSTSNEIVCAVMGGLLHYFMLVTFFLMAAEGVLVYLLIVVVVVSRLVKNYAIIATLIAWIVPVVVVVVSEAPNYTNYVGEQFCRPYGPPFYGGVLVPFAIMYILNWFFIILVNIKLYNIKLYKIKRHETVKLTQKQRLKRVVIAFIVLSWLLGPGWVFGLVATTSIPSVPVSVIFQVIFIIFTVFQGLGIFITQVIRHEAVQNKLVKIKGNYKHEAVQNKLVVRNFYKRVIHWCSLTSVCHPGRKVITFTASVVRSGQHSHHHEGNSSDFETLSSCDSFSDGCPEASTAC